jgi:hypothetical protein
MVCGKNRERVPFPRAIALNGQGVLPPIGVLYPPEERESVLYSTPDCTIVLAFCGVKFTLHMVDNISIAQGGQQG